MVVEVVRGVEVVRVVEVIMVVVGLKETRSLSSLYERWYDPPWVCLNENIGKNHKSYNLLMVWEIQKIFF